MPIAGDIIAPEVVIEVERYFFKFLLGAWAAGEERDAEDVVCKWLDERLTKEEKKKAAALLGKRTQRTRFQTTPSPSRDRRH